MTNQTQLRREAILLQLEREQQLSVTELSTEFGISAVSVRRDLEELERLGALRRVHGGAQAISRPGQLTPIQARLQQQIPVKRALGRAAAALIRPGQSIFLDSGSTVIETARQIPVPLLETGGLTVVTRSLLIAELFRPWRQTRLIVLGGVYAHDFDDFVGVAVEQSLAGLHVQTLFLGTDGITVERGLTTDNVMEAGLYRPMLSCAERVVVVVDSTKIGKEQVQATLPLSDVHTVVTDERAPQTFLRALRDLGCEVITVAAADG
jgi:DeoR family fructose operon transcriptional repressor